MVISHRLRLFLAFFEQLRSYAEFKADFHNVYSCTRQDPKKIWHKFPYLVMEAGVQEIVGTCPGE